jgi:excisionase family DNA binding protein
VTHYLTTTEAAEYTRCSWNAVYGAARSHELKSVRRGCAGRFFTLDDLDAWLRLGQRVTTPHVTRLGY